MVEAVKAFVSEHQGEKGFILTEDAKADVINDIEFNFDDTQVREFQVKAVRVKNNDLQVLTDVYNCTYDEDAVSTADENQWMSVQYDDRVYFIPTIFNIAENIEEYI